MVDSELRIGILISGNGSTMKYSIEASQEGVLQGKVKVVAVVADRPAPGMLKATEHGIHTYLLDRREFASSEEMGEEVMKICDKRHVDVILQNGWLSLTPENVIEEYLGRIFNQHPAEPAYFGGKGMYGLRVHAAVLGFQEKVQRRFPTAATIHHVTPKYDEGEVVMRKAVGVYEGDTPRILAERVLPVEHQLQIEFLKELYEGRVKVQTRSEPLILSGEEHLLYQAKETAINMYRKK